MNISQRIVLNRFRSFLIKMKQILKPTAVPTIFPRAVTPKRLRTSSAFRKAEIVSEASSSHTDAVSDEQSQEADNVDVSIRCYMVHASNSYFLQEELPSMAVQVNTRLQRKNAKIQVRVNSKDKGIHIIEDSYHCPFLQEHRQISRTDVMLADIL